MLMELSSMSMSTTSHDYWRRTTRQRRQHHLHLPNPICWPVYHAPLWGQPGLSTVGDVHHSGGISTIRDAASIHPCSISIGPWGHHLLRCSKSLVVPRSEPHKPIFGNSGEQNCFVWDAQNRAFSSGGTTIMGMKNVQQPDPPSLARLTFAGQVDLRWPGPRRWPG